MVLDGTNTYSENRSYSLNNSLSSSRSCDRQSKEELAPPLISNWLITTIDSVVVNGEKGGGLA